MTEPATGDVLARIFLPAKDIKNGPVLVVECHFDREVYFSYDLRIYVVWGNNPGLSGFDGQLGPQTKVQHRIDDGPVE